MNGKGQLWDLLSEINDDNHIESLLSNFTTPNNVVQITIISFLLLIFRIDRSTPCQCPGTKVVRADRRGK